MSETDRHLIETTTKNFSDSEARAFVATLDNESRRRLGEALREADNAASDRSPWRSILEEIERFLDEHDPGWRVAPEQAPGQAAIGVVFFRTTESDNGHVLTGDGEVFFADGTTKNYSFVIDDLLTAAYGTCGASAALAVNLRTGVLDFDDYGDQVYTRLGVERKG